MSGGRGGRLPTQPDPPVLAVGQWVLLSGGDIGQITSIEGNNVKVLLKECFVGRVMAGCLVRLN